MSGHGMPSAEQVFSMMTVRSSGHLASETLFRSKYRPEYPNSKLWPGSRLEWSMTPGTPVEIGPPGPAPGRTNG